MAKILVVEDEQDSSEALARILRMSGYEVETVPNGKVALESIIDAPPDLVVLDLLMPGMDGVSLLKILRSYMRLKTLPVVVWTGVGDAGIVDRIRTLDVNEVVPKGQPSFNELLRAVKDGLPPEPPN